MGGKPVVVRAPALTEQGARLRLGHSPTARPISKMVRPSPRSAIDRRIQARICSSRTVRCAGRRFTAAHPRRGPSCAAPGALPASGRAPTRTDATTGGPTASADGGGAPCSPRNGARRRGRRRCDSIPPLAYVFEFWLKSPHARCMVRRNSAQQEQGRAEDGAVRLPRQRIRDRRRPNVAPDPLPSRGSPGRQAGGWPRGVCG